MKKYQFAWPECLDLEILRVVRAVLSSSGCEISSLHLSQEQHQSPVPINKNQSQPRSKPRQCTSVAGEENESFRNCS